VPREFFARPALQVAPDLLGKVLARYTGGVTIRGRIVEAEAYTGQTDPGSHAFRGCTPRTMVMFGPPGFLYVYFTYGMHYCMNVVTDVDGVAGAVLIRALEPLDGMDEMSRRRGERPDLQLCNGPAKLCAALGVGRQENGADLEGSEIWLEDDGFIVNQVEVTTRVGLSAGDDLPFRFFIAGSRFVSGGRPAKATITRP